MPNRHSVFALGLILAALTSCTSRGTTDLPDTGGGTADGGMDTGATGDTGTSPDAARDGGATGMDVGNCGTIDLHSDIGAALHTGTTTGGMDRYDGGSCGSAGAPDVWFTWTAPAAGSYAIDTNGSSFDTTLAVLTSCSGTSLACDDDGGTGVTSEAHVTLAAHQTVVIIVDGLGSGEEGSYTLGIRTYVPENCTNGTDDDGDGAVDCADYADCDTNAACTETGAECSDTIDNDGDGDVDCLDFDCDGDPACTETACDDGADNDGDGTTDCADYDCTYTFPGCDESMHCDDGVDNDVDGIRDCADSDCTYTFPACDESMHCADGIDNDGDIDVDCADYSCNTDPACVEAGHCGDHADNDGDDEIDCSDTDCATDAACTTHETNCQNGADDDNDGWIDCADTDCDAVCMENTDALCMNTMDDDTDGLVDCADRQCSCSTPCPPAVAPSATCPDTDIGSALGVGVYHGTIAPYACGARADSSCGSGGRGAEIEIAWKAPAAGTYVFDTTDTSLAGGTFDTILSVRTDCSGTSSEIDCSDDGGTGNQARAWVTLEQDQNVIIVLDAYDVWDGGNVTLNIYQQ